MSDHNPSLKEIVFQLFAHKIGTPSEMEKALQDLLNRGFLTLGPPPKTTEAQELWDALDLHANDHITDAVLVAKIADFDKGVTALSMSATDGVDWVTQLGILHGAIGIMNTHHYEPRQDD